MSEVILIRCDLYLGSGAGHLKRCSVLAKELKKSGLSPIIVLDEDCGSIPIKLSVPVERFAFTSYNEETDAESLVELAVRYNARKVIGDSYRISSRWVFELKSKGLSVILLDDLQIGAGADLEIDYSPAALGNLSEPNRLCGPSFFITDSPVNKPREAVPRKIALHAGGTGMFSATPFVYTEAVKMAQEKGLLVSWICPTKGSRSWVEASGLLFEGDSILEWQKGCSDVWSDFDIVVGPSSTSLFEAIMQGTLPVSFPISKTQTSKRSDWIKIGHALHLDFLELEDVDIIKKIIALAFTGFSKLRSALTRHSKLIDENGGMRVARAIVDLPKKFEIQHRTVSSCAALNIRAVNLTDAVAFLVARNSPLARKISTDPNHIITWPEHLYWWLQATTERFVVDSAEGPVAYFWHKSKRVGLQDYLIGGWFPADDKPAFAAAVYLLDWQLDYCANIFPEHIWLATINKDNRAVLSLNSRYGFIEADLSSRTAIQDLFPGTDKNFAYLQRKSVL